MTARYVLNRGEGRAGSTRCPFFFDFDVVTVSIQS